MSKIANSLTELIGKTPLLQLNNYAKANGLNANVVGKLEYYNPAGSVKDRIALAMIEDPSLTALKRRSRCGCNGYGHFQ